MIIDILKHDLPEIHHCLINLRRHFNMILLHAALYDIMYKCIQTFSRCIPQQHSKCHRYIVFCNNAGSLRIIHIMMDISKLIRQADHLSFHRRRISTDPVIQDPIPYFPCKIQSFTILLQHLHYPDALSIMCKTSRMDLIQCLLPGMSERSMPQVMPQCDCFHQIFIQAQCLRNRPCNLRYLKRMCKTVSVMVSLWCKKNLCLVLHSPKCLTVQNSVPVSLIDCADITFFLLPFSASGMTTVCRIRT